MCSYKLSGTKEVSKKKTLKGIIRKEKKFWEKEKRTLKIYHERGVPRLEPVDNYISIGKTK